MDGGPPSMPPGGTTPAGLLGCTQTTTAPGAIPPLALYAPGEMHKVSIPERQDPRVSLHHASETLLRLAACGPSTRRNSRHVLYAWSPPWGGVWCLGRRACPHTPGFPCHPVPPSARVRRPELHTGCELTGVGAAHVFHNRSSWSSGTDYNRNSYSCRRRGTRSGAKVATAEEPAQRQGWQGGRRVACRNVQPQRSRTAPG